ncbi:hypothetical protein [Winogradskyella sp. 3972H.M.0a.05]|uniref:hypothetical protein n=1 Tax=Winogradskyella sp. 3972H.M.0a.05 TaxID=2950277 RepID=UPI003395A3FF
MSQKLAQIVFQIILTLTLFSFWAAFALLVVNKLFYKDLPGYTIGRLCIWELVAILVAAILARLMIKKWGNITLQNVGDKTMLSLNPKYGVYFVLYFLVAVVIAIWQFWLFSQQF